MTYVIQGTLLVQEKPEKYMNKSTNESLAQSLCKQKEITIEDMKLFAPREGWEEYLTTAYSEIKNFQTLEGLLGVWNEKRLPIPWLYVFSQGTIKDKYEFDGTNFFSNPQTRYEGNSQRWGFMLETPLLSLTLNKFRRYMWQSIEVQDIDTKSCGINKIKKK